MWLNFRPLFCNWDVRSLKQSQKNLKLTKYIATHFSVVNAVANKLSDLYSGCNYRRKYIHGKNIWNQIPCCKCSRKKFSNRIYGCKFGCTNKHRKKYCNRWLQMRSQKNLRPGFRLQLLLQILKFKKKIAVAEKTVTKLTTVKLVTKWLQIYDRQAVESQNGRKCFGHHHLLIQWEKEVMG